jgi:Lar family restriction alleviation protein
VEEFDVEIEEFFERNLDVKKCPFCGSKYVSINRRGGKYGKFYFMQCTICGAQSGTSAAADNALEKWNNRSKGKDD